MTHPAHTNSLAQEKSPYLLQHAHNPVDWQAFLPEAFEQARTLDRPIFLSIGYSTCHWCHVMERESFEDEETARLMNELYVNIKVDREERPDVDQIYMRAVMLMQGQGGWPLNVWLTPDLRPFFGGTYFPPQPRHGQPAFREVLVAAERLYRQGGDQLEERARDLMQHLSQPLVPAAPEAGELPASLAESAARDVLGLYEPRFGGFGGAPKFPQPGFLALLAHRLARQPDADLSSALQHTLEMMWRGGIYDHVGGGFSRYSTDSAWLVPHFEKMLYDNAQLVEAYLDGHLLLGDVHLGSVAADILHFVAREMTHPQGGFYSAQDADSEGVEGRFYIFTQDHLKQALGADQERAARLYGVTSTGNFEGQNILHWPRSVAETAAMEGLQPDEVLAFHAEVRQRLYAFREQRVRPGLDDKVLTAWNGLMIAAAARAARVLDEPAFLTLAERAADFIDTNLRAAEGALLRRWRAGEARYLAGLDDHTFFAWGCLALYQATGSARWLGLTLDLLQAIRERFADPDSGLFFDAQDHDDLLLRLKDPQDGALPAGNGLLALLLARVGALLEDEDLRQQARSILEGCGAALVRHPRAFPSLVCAFEELREGPRTLFLSAGRDPEDFEKLLVAAHRDPCPGRVIAPIPAAEVQDLARLGVPVEGREPTQGAPRGWLCEQGACRPWPKDLSSGPSGS